jgi:hypothetical protein
MCLINSALVGKRILTFLNFVLMVIQNLRIDTSHYLAPGTDCYQVHLFYINIFWILACAVALTFRKLQLLAF